MRSLQVKVSALVIALLVVACVSLAWRATDHERGALQEEVEKRAWAEVKNLAGAAKEPLLEVGGGDSEGELKLERFEAELTLERLVEQLRNRHGVVAARLIGCDDKIVASLEPSERKEERTRLTVRADGPPERFIEVRASRLLVAEPVLFSDVPVGEAQVELDLRELVDRVADSNTRELTFVAVVVVALGVVAGTIFVALLVGPLRRLRAGVEKLSAGDLSVRVPPTSRDEVGELTRAFNEMGDSLQQKQRIQSAFGRYVNDYVLNQLLEGPDDDLGGGIQREVTILFADIRRFTRLSEDMKAPDVVALLNEIFQLVSDPILERGGTIDKFIGDSVMAYFGAPVPQGDHAARAVAAAIEITRAIEERNRRARSVDPGDSAGAPVEVGIGVHTGAVVVGNIGCDWRTDFTAVGDAVNVAHRLEKLARPGEILVSEAVQRLVRAEVRLHFEGERQLSGREEPVHVYAVDADRIETGMPGGRPPARA